LKRHNLNNGTVDKMNPLKLITAGLLALLVIHFASAQTEIRLTGSTTFQPGTIDAIQHILQPGYVWGSTSGSGAGANQQVFVGTTKIANIQVIIKTSWTDSVSGVQSLAQNIPAAQPFIIDPTGVTFAPAAGGTVGVVPLTNAGANIPGADITESHTADVALSDIFASTTPYTGAGVIPLADTLVGVVPFAWVKGAYTPDSTLGSAVAGGYPGVANLSGVQAQELFSGGLALNQFTGIPSDQAVFVGIVGQDHTSGIRIGAIYDTQYGNYFSPILQDIPNGATVESAGSGVISSLFPWPAETVDGEIQAAGNGGFSSGNFVAITLNRPCDTSQGNYIISYLGMADAQRVNPGPGVAGIDGVGNPYTYTPSQNALTFDGYYPGTAASPFAPPYANVIEGKYTLWGYGHYLYDASLVAVNLKTVADQIAAQLSTEADYGGTGILLSAMNASRAGDGTPVTSP
jgi:hypothetical protein